MGIPGIDSILYQPASVVWPGEQPPHGRLAKLIDILTDNIERDVITNGDQKLVDEMASMALTPSQTMRLHYFQAYLLRERQPNRAYKAAYTVFGDALDIVENYARAHDGEYPPDLDSQFVLMDQLAVMHYGLMRHRDAIDHYEMTLDLWRQREAQIIRPRAEPEAHLHGCIAASQFAIGEFDAAQGSVARVLTIARERPDIPQTRYLREVTASALWTLGLIHRAQSDQRDGDESLLLAALKCLQEALRIFKRVGAHEFNAGRIRVQITETACDLSEFYLRRGQDTKVRNVGQKALATGLAARDIMRHADDPSGRLLIELALMRCEITRLPSDAAIREADDFHRRLLEIERKARRIPDAMVSAKAATLRGQWCLWLGDAPHAREAFLPALAGMQPDNAGETTRLYRLLRRSNTEPQPLRVQRHRATGPRVSRPRRRS
jgi:tetratricopeptide (TPR) repeat protein